MARSRSRRERELLTFKLRPHLVNELRISAGFRQRLKTWCIDKENNLGKLLRQVRLTLLFSQVAHGTLCDLIGATGDSRRRAHVGETENTGQHHRGEEKEDDEDEGRGEQNQAQITGVAQHGGLPLLDGAQAGIRARPHSRRNLTG